MADRAAGNRDDQPRYCCYGCRFAASVTASGGDEAQARWAMTRLGLSIFFAMNVMVFTMLLWSAPEQVALSTGASVELVQVWYELARYACLLFTLPVVLLLGGPLVLDAAAEMQRGRPSLSLLLCAGMAAALSYSVWSLVAGGGHVYFEVAATILVAVTLGKWFEATGKLRTTAALRGLAALLPDTVRLVTRQGEQAVPASALAAGDEFRVLPGERVVADGWVVRHQAAIDEQAITGESLPILRRPGDRIMSGCLVLDGPLDIRAAAPAGEGTLARMIAAVTQATFAGTHYERLAERISRWALPAIAVIAAGTLAVHAWRGSLAEGLLAALAVVVIACPCALGLATPMALWAAIGRAAQAGVLVREGDALSLLARARIMGFDKTGTLTTGEAAVEDLHVNSTDCERLCLAIAGALARASNHPLAQAVTRYADGRLGPGQRLMGEQILVRSGRGIAGTTKIVRGPAYLGSREWLAECGQALPGSLDAAVSDRAAETLVGWNGLVRGRFTFREQVRPEAETTITLLKRLGLRCVMLSGDREARAAALAGALGLDWRARLLPEAKLAAIRELQAGQGPVAMVGDGLNDAPALAAADVGIALGSGADLSRHSAKICLLTNDLLRLPWLVSLARRTERTIRWNLVWAFGYNAVGIAVAAAGWLHPVMAAVAMGASSLLVVTNSLGLANFDRAGSTEAGG